MGLNPEDLGHELKRHQKVTYREAAQKQAEISITKRSRTYP